MGHSDAASAIGIQAKRWCARRRVRAAGGSSRLRRIRHSLCPVSDVPVLHFQTRGLLRVRQRSCG
jgi:hypothetical protein